ncbi:MAG: Flp family type IVb pilin [Magnetospiraceae bacterium]
MAKVAKIFQKLRRCQRGATAIEYGLIAGAMSIVIVIMVFAAGDSLESTFVRVNSVLDERM